MGPIRNIALISILLISSACRKDIGRLKNETVDSDSIASINVDTDTADFGKIRQLTRQIMSGFGNIIPLTLTR
jgi:hypothetical protein